MSISPPSGQVTPAPVDQNAGHTLVATPSGKNHSSVPYSCVRHSKRKVKRKTYLHPYGVCTASRIHTLPTVRPNQRAALSISIFNEASSEMGEERTVIRFLRSQPDRIALVVVIYRRRVVDLPINPNERTTEGSVDVAQIPE